LIEELYLPKMMKNWKKDWKKTEKDW